MAYDIQLSKVLNKTDRIATYSLTSDSDWTSGTSTLIVEIPAETVEDITKKTVVTIQRGRSKSLYSKYDPYIQLWDFKKILRVFRAKGTISKSSWTTIKAEMDKIMIIVEDGGTFTFTWHTGNDKTINCMTYKFTQTTKKADSVDFVIDLVEGVARS